MIGWEAWGAEAFARAARENKPVLLSISAAWCHACREMDRSTYADAEVARLVAARFVPVRVDTDRRPDINERYNLGGWPTTAFLTAEGALITGGTFVAAERMPSVLTRVAEAFAARAADWAAASERGEDTDSADLSVEDVELTDRVFAAYDAEFGGFGVEPKFPHAAPVHLALALFRDTGDARWRAIVETTLDAMWSGLWDASSGGFYRYAATRDWQQPHVEKLLETNAALLAVYTDASVTLGRPAERERVGAIARFITGALSDARGGYAGSDAEPALYAEGNAIAASALMKAAALLGDSGLARDALASFERVLLGCYKPGEGIAHHSGGVRGLLGDQIAAIGALLDAHELTGAEPYSMMAEEIGHYAVRRLADDGGDGFFDRVPCPDDVGLLRMRRKPYAGNAEAAVALSRLQRVSREFDFTVQAAGALRVAARQASGQGPLASQYLLAVRQVR